MAETGMGEVVSPSVGGTAAASIGWSFNRHSTGTRVPMQLDADAVEGTHGTPSGIEGIRIVSGGPGGLEPRIPATVGSDRLVAGKS